MMKKNIESIYLYPTGFWFALCIVGTLMNVQGVFAEEYWAKEHPHLSDLFSQPTRTWTDEVRLSAAVTAVEAYNEFTLQPGFNLNTYAPTLAAMTQLIHNINPNYSGLAVRADAVRNALFLHEPVVPSRSRSNQFDSFSAFFHMLYDDPCLIRKPMQVSPEQHPDIKIIKNRVIQPLFDFITLSDTNTWQQVGSEVGSVEMDFYPIFVDAYWSVLNDRILGLLRSIEALEFSSVETEDYRVIRDAHLKIVTDLTQLRPFAYLSSQLARLAVNSLIENGANTYAGASLNQLKTDIISPVRVLTRLLTHFSDVSKKQHGKLVLKKQKRSSEFSNLKSAADRLRIKLWHQVNGRDDSDQLSQDR